MADIKHDDNLIEMDDTPTLMSKMSRLTNQQYDSRFYKIMNAILQRSNDFDTALEKMNIFHSLEYLTGKSLDYFGEQFNVYRAGANDDFYKFKIRAAMVAATADGTTDSIIKAVAYILDCQYSDVRIIQAWQTGGEARTITITGLPFQYASDPDAVRFLTEQLARSVEATIRINGTEFSQIDEQSLYVGNAAVTQSRFIIQNRGIN